MAKFQLCEFLRTKPTTMFKKDTVWSRGIAKLDDALNIQMIFDEDGKEVKKIFSVRKCIGQGFTEKVQERCHAFRLAYELHNMLLAMKNFNIKLKFLPLTLR